MIYCYLLLIVSFAQDLFSLVPKSTINEDIGLALILVALAYRLTFKQFDAKIFLNFFSLYTLAYLLLVGTQPAMASIYYSQSIVDGLIAIRDQLYYLAFFLYCLVFTDRRKSEIFLNCLTVTSFLLIFLSLVNYFAFTIFSHRFAEGHGMRGGILRAYVPGLEIIVLSAIWNFLNYVKSRRTFHYSIFVFLIMFGGILFSQYRGFIITVIATCTLILVIERKFGLLLMAAAALFAVAIAISIGTGENLLLNAFILTYEEVTNVSGNWEARMSQIRQSWTIMQETFWTGSGGVAVRETGWTNFVNLRNIARGHDLGYWVWLKYFGIGGVTLMIFFTSGLFAHIRSTRMIANENDRRIAEFGGYYLISILISMVTIPYFTQGRGIIVLSLGMALLYAPTRYRTEQLIESTTRPAS